MDPIEQLKADLSELERIVNQERIDRAVLQEKVNSMKADVDALPSLYVTKAEFGPVRSVTYGLVAAVLMLFFTALGAIVFGTPGAGTG